MPCILYNYHCHFTDISKDENTLSVLEKYEETLLYLFQEGLPVVQTMMKNFSGDLGVSTEGRKFIFFYAKLPQLQ